MLVEIGHGLSNADIGGVLFMSEATVKSHVSQLLAKLGATNRVTSSPGPTRDDLLEAVVRAEFTEDVAAVAAAYDDDPERHLAEAIGLLTARWLADEGSIYLPVGVLALHNERLASVWEEIYDEFYGVISEIVGRIDPTVTPDAALARASLITSLIDGASLQRLPAVAPRLRTSGAISDLAVRIARGI